ncbi:hypothetical protein ACFFWE_30200 [Sphaerisporangium melleum]|nr:hypothetical protein [Sphaerisporangium melleum]
MSYRRGAPVALPGDGEGIAVADRERIFQRFAQAGVPAAATRGWGTRERG